MNLNFNELVTKLSNREITPEEFHQKLEGFSDFDEELLIEIKNYTKLKNIFVLTNLIWAIHRFPSSKFTEILCFLLEQQPESSYMEAIVDALHDIRDEESIPSLEQVLDYYEIGDSDFAFNRKVLWVLEKIGTQKAFDVIKKGLNNENQIINEMAKEILERN